MKIVSVMTTTSAGGAEFAAVEMLDALAARGHDVVLLSDMPEIGRDTAVAVAPLQIGPKLSVRSWRRLMADWPRYIRRLRRALERPDALRRAARPLQEGAADGAVAAAPAPSAGGLGGVGPGAVPVPRRAAPPGLPPRRPPGQPRHGRLGRHEALGRVGRDPRGQGGGGPQRRRRGRDPLHRGGPADRPGAARDRAGRVRGGLHLAVSPQEAQRRRRRRGPAPRRLARPPDHGRSGGDRDRPARAGPAARRSRPLRPDPESRRGRGHERVRRERVLPVAH